MQGYRRDLPKDAILVVCAPLVWEKVDFDIHPRGGVIHGVYYLAWYQVCDVYLALGGESWTRNLSALHFWPIARCRTQHSNRLVPAGQYSRFGAK